MIFNVACSKEEHSRIGPKIQSTMIQHSLNFYCKFSTSVDDFTCEFDHHAKMLCNNKFVSDHSNTNLTNAQKELLLWHWKWGISMERIQELMRPQSSKDQDGKISLRPSVIKPKFPSASSCAMPVCHSCELARAKKRNPKVMKQQAIKEKEGVLVLDLGVRATWQLRFHVELAQSWWDGGKNTSQVSVAHWHNEQRTPPISIANNISLFRY